ncbi:MAG: hypothetical protein ACXAC8_07720 [Candidatus Hodarchaeales archaeon]|jgi:hypothetical protein
MNTTVCGVRIDTEGYLVTKSNASENRVKPAVIFYNDQKIYFCEELCKQGFLEADNKEVWIENHK